MFCAIFNIDAIDLARFLLCLRASSLHTFHEFCRGRLPRLVGSAECRPLTQFLRLSVATFSQSFTFSGLSCVREKKMSSGIANR